VLYSFPALVQRDGDVMGTDGNTLMNLPMAAGGYRIAVKHRNHLGAATATPWSLAAVVVELDMGTAMLYGTNPMANHANAGKCLWAGDATGNGTIRYTGSGNDRDPILIAVGSTAPNNSVSNVYDRRDTNLDGLIKYTGTGNDRDIILTNVGSTTPNNTRTQQVP
jgi:hypothetical protein